MKNDTDINKFYEIEKLVERRIRKFDRTKATQCLVREVDYESGFDE